VTKTPFLSSELLYTLTSRQHYGVTPVPVSRCLDDYPNILQLNGLKDILMGYLAKLSSSDTILVDWK
jgi:hypothetical protein